MNETDRTQPSAISLSSNYDGNPNGFPNVILHYPQNNRKYTSYVANTQDIVQRTVDTPLLLRKLSFYNYLRYSMNQSTLYNIVKGIYRLHSTLKQLADLLIPFLKLYPVASLQVESAALGVRLVPLRRLGGGHDPEPVDHVGDARLELQDGKAVPNALPVTSVGSNLILKNGGLNHFTWAFR